MAFSFPVIHVPTAKEQRKHDKLIGNVIVLMVGLPVKVLSEEYHYSDEDCETVALEILEGYEAVQDEYVDLTDIVEVVSEEANLIIENIFKEFKLGSRKDDIGFLLTSSISIMKLMDKHGFTNEECDAYAHKLVQAYVYYRRGYTTVYELTRMIKKKTGIVIKPI